MSRTDAHRPWAVQVKDPHIRHLLYSFQIWPWQHELVPVKNLCGCRLCTDYYQRKAARRADRHRARRDLRDLRAQAAAGRLDEDDPPLRRIERW